jgi:hypothetical protein
MTAFLENARIQTIQFFWRAADDGADLALSSGE